MNKPFVIAVILPLLILANGCDTFHGITREADVHKLPEFSAVIAHIRKYPEIDEVKYLQKSGGRPLTFSGIQSATQVYYITYKGSEDIFGSIHFTEDYNGNIVFHQSLVYLNRPVPEKMIEATLPIMERIEKDLEEKFGFTNLQKDISVHYFGMNYFQ